MTRTPRTSEYLPSEYLSSTAEKYNAYQQRYAEEPRESDKVLIELLRGVVADRLGRCERLSLLDIGCSTGNLLAHIGGAVPGLELTGGDLAESAIAGCRIDPRLDDIAFEVMDLFDLPTARFDVVVANAVLYFLDDEQLDLAASSIGGSLRPDGALLAFDFFHESPQELRIVEVSRSHPDGIRLHFRPFALVRKTLVRHGFTDVRFQPLRIPIDLERGTRYTDDDSGFEDLNSYTVQTQDGERLVFRGVLYQPWCHLVAKKGAR